MWGRIKDNWMRPVCILWVLVSLIVIGHRFSSGIPIDTNIHSILPSQIVSPNVHAAMSQSDNVAANRIVLLITDQMNGDQSKEASEDLKHRLIAANLFLDDREDMETIGRWLFENRNEVLCESDKNFTSQTAQTIRKQALAKVYGVGAPITGDLLKADPFLLTLRLSECLSQGASNLPQNQSLLSGKMTQSAFRLDTQTQILNVIVEWEKDWLPKNVELARAGAVFHAAQGVKSAKSEMALIGGFGLLGVVALFWFIFGRAINVFFVASIIALSCASGLAVSLFIFPNIHILVLVFAAMLVGVVADYAVHAMATGVGNNWPDESLRRTHLWRPMTVSMLTTAAGFAGLVFLGVPMFQQLAVFAVVGVLTAWALVLFVFLPMDKSPKSGIEKLSTRWKRVLSFSSRILPTSSKSAIAAAVLGILTLLSFMLAKPLDDVRTFQSKDPHLMQQENQIAEIIGSMTSQVFLVSSGTSLEQAKQREEAALAELPLEMSAFALTCFDPSQVTRVSNRASLNEKLEVPFETSHRAQLGINSNIPSIVEIENIKRPSWFENFYVEEGGSHFLIARLSGSGDVNLEIKEGVSIVDTAGQYSSAFSTYRKLASWSLLAAVGVALVFVILVYRRVVAISIVLAPSAAMICGVYLPALLGQNVTFFSMAGAMVLFGVGVDYSAFMWESGKTKEPWAKASVLIGAATTFLSMGLLALSDTLPVRSFGITVAVGVICALVFSTLPYYLASKDLNDAK